MSEISFDIVAKNGNNIEATCSIRQCCLDTAAGRPMDGASGPLNVKSTVTGRPMFIAWADPKCDIWCKFHLLK